MVLHPMRPVFCLLIAFMIWCGLSKDGPRFVTELAQLTSHSSQFAIPGSEFLARTCDRNKDAPSSGFDHPACLVGALETMQRHMAQTLCRDAPIVGHHTGPCGSNLARAPPRLA